MDRKRFLMIFCSLTLILGCLGTLSAKAAPFGQEEEEIELVLTGDEDPAAESAEEAAEGVLPEPGAADGSENPEEEPAEEEPEPVDPPAAPVPEKTADVFTSGAVGFYWAPAENADAYEVKWHNEAGEEGSLVLEGDDWTCLLGRCITYGDMPGSGTYFWLVNAINVGGETPSEELSFTIDAKIPAPDAYRPNGKLSNRKPLIFEWEDVTHSITSARIQVAEKESGLLCLDKWYDISAVTFVNGECYMPTNEYLSSGSYIWRVQTRGADSVSDWSRWQDFSVNCADCDLGTWVNTSIEVIYPVSAMIETQPEFRWQALTGAAYYELTVTDPEGTEVLNERVEPAICGIEICAYKPEFSPAVGEQYTWKITARGATGGTWGYDESSFSLSALTEMNPISFVGPENGSSLDPDNQQVIWTDPGEATAVFRLGIRDSADEWLFIGDLTREDAWCDGITCSIQFMSIPEGDDYEVLIVPYSEFNIPGEGIALSFNNRPEED